jgi:hypothetical protein
MTPISRRGVLATIAAGIAGSAAARPVETAQYVVEQGDRCVPVTPLSTDQTAEAFYDYRTPDTSPSGSAYSSYGTTDLQRPDTSVCFLYDGPEGLSLVLLHDRLNDGTNGGAITFRLASENPDRGAWIVGDDDYDAATNYDSFTRTDGGWRIDWTWAEGRSDGGVYRPLGDDFAVTIDPAFNEEAALYGDHYEGEITDWQVLSGDRSDPDRFSLALDSPLMIRPGSCGERTTTATTTTTTTEEDEGRSSELISPDVEIVPGKVNPRSHGRLPVVVHSSEAFDATDLKPGTVAFGPAEKSELATPAKRIRTDADEDGRRDLKLLFWMDETHLEWGTETVQLTGETENGQAVEASVEVELVPNGDDDERDDNDETEAEEDESEAEEDETDEREGEDNEEREGEEDEDHEEEDEKEDDDADGEDGDDDERDENEDDHPGRGNGNGRGEGRGEGSGKGRDNGQGGENGNGRGKGKDNGRGRGRGKGD